MAECTICGPHFIGRCPHLPDPDIARLFEARRGTNLDAHGFAVGKAARGERSGCWMTPRAVLDRGLAVVRDTAGWYLSDAWEEGWGLDAAAEPGSAVASLWYGPGSLLRADALAAPAWTDGAPGPVWLNPPYSEMPAFAARAEVEAAQRWVGWLSFARTDTRAFQGLWWSPRLRAYSFIPGRIRFVDPVSGKAGQSAPAPSVFLVLGPGDAPALRVRW